MHVQADLAKALTIFLLKKTRQLMKKNKTITDEAKKEKKISRNPAVLTIQNMKKIFWMIMERIEGERIYGEAI